MYGILNPLSLEVKAVAISYTNRAYLYNPPLTYTYHSFLKMCGPALINFVYNCLVVSTAIICDCYVLAVNS